MFLTQEINALGLERDNMNKKNTFNFQEPVLRELIQNAQKKGKDDMKCFNLC